jgi:hypothetical protein
MHKHDLMLRTMATALDVPEAAVRSRWTILRKEGLWSKVGRGRAMPDTTPTDLTNMLLSFQAGGHATKAAEAVRLLRGSLAWDGDDFVYPPIAGLGFAEDHTLGEMLDALLALWARDGKVMVESHTWEQISKRSYLHDEKLLELALARDLTVDEMEFVVRRTWAGWETWIHIILPGYPALSKTYTAVDPKIDRLLRDKGGKPSVAKLGRNQFPDQATVRIISHRTLAATAACLRGDAKLVDEVLGWKSYVRYYERYSRNQPKVEIDVAFGLINLIEPSRRRR